MDQSAKTFTSEGVEARNLIGRIIVALILGEAIWSLIVSVMNNLVVPWLGDVMGQSSGLPTSFTQRPYNYPDLFVSVLELCFAGIVAAVLHHFFERPGTVKPAKSVVATARVEPARVGPQVAATAALPPVARSQATSPVGPPEPVAKQDRIVLPAPTPESPAAQTPPVASAQSGAVASPLPSVENSTARPLPQAPKAEPAKLGPLPPKKKSKEVYYNIVGEPVASDED